MIIKTVFLIAIACSATAAVGVDSCPASLIAALGSTYARAFFHSCVLLDAGTHLHGVSLTHKDESGELTSTVEVVRYLDTLEELWRQQIQNGYDAKIVAEPSFAEPSSKMLPIIVTTNFGAAAAQVQILQVRGNEVEVVFTKDADSVEIISSPSGTKLLVLHRYLDTVDVPMLYTLRQGHWTRVDKEYPEYYKNLLRHSPSFKQKHINVVFAPNLAELLWLSGRKEKALELLDDAAKRQPHSQIQDPGLIRSISKMRDAIQRDVYPDKDSFY